MAPWLYLGAMVALMAVVAVGTAHSGAILRTWIPPYNLLLSWPDNLLRLALIAICVGIGLGPGPGPDVLGWSMARLPANLLWGLEAGAVLAIVLSLAGWVAVRCWGQDIYSNKMMQCILPASGREWPGVLLALLPAAAIEELLFRSLPLGGLDWLVAPVWLLWPLSLFFGLLHWPQGWWGVAGTALAAVAFSLLFLASGSLWVPLTAHYLINVSQLILARWTGMQPLRARTP